MSHRPINVQRLAAFLGSGTQRWDGLLTRVSWQGWLAGFTDHVGRRCLGAQYSNVILTAE
jgi:hypothetical protein